jgi:purine-binding chemotaxis protein CheW
LRELTNDGRHELTLVCQLRGALCGFPLTHVVETMRPLPVEPVAGAPAFVAGLAIIRGAAVPVVDAAQLLADGQLGSVDTDPKARFVLLDAGGRPVALAVAGVVGVRSLPADSHGPMPRLLSQAGAHVIATVGALDAELLLVLQAAHLLPAGFGER